MRVVIGGGDSECLGLYVRISREHVRYESIALIDADWLLSVAWVRSGAGH
jgi:hypothetical protein